MLNLSENSIRHLVKEDKYSAYQKIGSIRIHKRFRYLLLAFAFIFLIFLFLPWTQNVQADGALTSLRPEHRPQTVHATISGRVEHWYVTEGQFVKKGDTLAYLTEVKTEYFDPALVQRTGEQVEAKTGSVQAYGGKIEALDAQIRAMRSELINKTEQIKNKVKQARLKVQSDSIDLERVRLDFQIAQRQFDATKTMYEKGLKPLTDFEDKKMKIREGEVKLVSMENKYNISLAELENYQTDLMLTQNEYKNKIAKAESDKYSTLSNKFDAEASINKLKIDKENYSRRAAFYYITAPQDGYVVQTMLPGIGEIIKEGSPLLSILPAGMDLAVEMFVKPMDLPLIQVGHKVRFIFDGWPAFVFSGWPGQSFGTYGGRVFAIDRNTSKEGKFRVLVQPDADELPWPDALRIGGGAKGLMLLNDVPIWYEIWRDLNGFPPEFYKADEKTKDAGSSKEKTKK